MMIARQLTCCLCVCTAFCDEPIHFHVNDTCFSKATRMRLDRDLYFMYYIKTNVFFFFCINRLHIKILIAYRQKISTTAIIAIGVIGVVNNIPPTNKQVLPHNKYTYGFEMSFFKLYRRWNLCFWNKKLSCTTLFSIWVLMSLFEKISVSSNYFFSLIYCV